MLKKKTFPSLINIKLSEKALMSLTGPQRSRHLLTTFLQRSRKRVMESPPDFSGKSGNRIRYFEDSGERCRLRVGKTGHPHDAPPKRVLRLFRTVMKFIGFEILLKYLLDVAEFGKVTWPGVRASSCLLAKLLLPYSQTYPRIPGI